MSETKKNGLDRNQFLSAVKTNPGIHTCDLKRSLLGGKIGLTGIDFIQTRKEAVDAGLVKYDSNNFSHVLTPEGEMELAKLLSPEAANQDLISKTATA